MEPKAFFNIENPIKEQPTKHWEEMFFFLQSKYSLFFTDLLLIIIKSDLVLRSRNIIAANHADVGVDYLQSI